MSAIVDLSERTTHINKTMWLLYDLSRSHVGDYKWSAQSQDTNGWVLCDGRSLSRTDYQDLFATIGTAFGAADSTTFRLPDARGRIMAATGAGSQRTLGSLVGAETVTLTTNELPAHTHTGTTNADGSHTHTTNATGGNIGLIIANGLNTAGDTDSSAVEPNVWAPPQALTVDSAGSHTHTFTTGSTGNGQPVSIMQPTLYGGNLFIYAGPKAPGVDLSYRVLTGM